MDYSYIVNKRKKNNKIKKTFNIKKIIGKCVIFLLFISVVAACYYGYKILEEKVSNEFLIEKIEVIGTKNIQTDDILNFLKKYKNKSLVSLDLGVIFKGLTEHYEWVKDVILHKGYPNRLVVEIIEETPIGLLNCNGKFYVLTDTGKVLKQFNRKLIFSGLYIFTVKDFKRYSALKDTILKIHRSAEEIKMSNISEIVLGKDITIYTFNPRRKYVLDITALKENFSKIADIKKVSNRLNKNFKEVNLKYKNKIFIKL